MNRTLRTAGCFALLVASCAALSGCKKDKEEKKTEETAAAATSAPETYTISSSVSGPGSVSLSPRRTHYDHGTKVTLTARPHTGAQFIGWSGDAGGEASSITLTIKSDLQITGRFDWPAPERQLRGAVEALLLAAKDRETSGAALEERIGAVANGFGDHRDALYGAVSKADEAFLEELSGCGEDASGLASMEDLVLQEVGPWAFLPGRTASLRMLYEQDPRLPKCSASEFYRHQRAWLAAAKRGVEGLDDPQRLGSYLLAPRLTRTRAGADELSSAWSLSRNRREAFEQERRVYVAAAALTDDSTLSARLEEEARAIEELREIDDELLAIVLEGNQTPAATPAASPSAALPTPAADSAQAGGATSSLDRMFGPR